MIYGVHTTYALEEEVCREDKCRSAQRELAILMEASILNIWNQKDGWFRDYAQAHRVGTTIVDRLADDRIQEECRYLVRLTSHILAGYKEVSYEELQRYVSAEKMKRPDELFAQIIAKDYVGIEEWVDRCKEELPIIEDKWMQKHGPHRDVRP